MLVEPINLMLFSIENIQLNKIQDHILEILVTALLESFNLLLQFFMCMIITRTRQNFREGKLSRLCVKYTIYWKTYAVHQAVAITSDLNFAIYGKYF